MTDPARGHPATPYSVETVTTDSALGGIEADWDRLNRSAEHPNPFATFGWYRAWSRRSAREDRAGRFSPYVLVLKDGDEVVGIAPLIKRVASSIFRVRKLAFVTHHADYNDLVLGGDQQRQIPALIEHLARTSRQWDVADLGELRDTGSGTALIEAALTRAGLPYRISIEKESCPYLLIDRDANNIMQRLSGHIRRTLRRRMERAEADGLRARIVEAPHQQPGLLEKLLTLDRQKHLRSSYPSFVGTYPEVFQALFDSLGPQGWLYVALLEQGDRPVAFQLGFRSGGQLWDYTKAHDRSFDRFAPGTLLLPALLDYGFQRGFHEYDFLRGEEPYKLVWSTGCHRRSHLLIWNRRPVSQLRKFFYHDVKVVVRHLLRRGS